ncbi:cation:proton antiporter [Ornithinimicrobium sp. Arc0846-15]|nr:cation:proton antiporter [Ornithinimicrobium laminariae]
MVELLIIAVAIYAFAMLSEKSAMSPVTAPMCFTTVGLLVGAAGLGWFDLSLEGEGATALVEATLVLVLFVDASRMDLRALRKSSALPVRLLAIGLPLTIILGTLTAMVLFDQLSVVEAALVAAVLAPTDAALGQAVVSDRRLPVRIRQSLNVESGLNDGIMVPVVTVFLALAAVEEEVASASEWGTFIAAQLGFGLTAGVIAGAGGGWLLHRRAAAHQVEGVYRQLAIIAMALAAFAGAEALGGNGFIAAFVAGLAFARVAPKECQDVQDFTEDEAELLTTITFLIFGAIIAGPRIENLTWEIALYGVLSLTVVRIVPVVISMIGSGTRYETRVFFGWFGPRGLASILFALIVFEDMHNPTGELVMDIAVWTVLFSVFAHGLTASPWAGRLGRKLEKGPADMAEMVEVPELPTRRGRP